jgi:DNA-3-methyladenine glycosylase
MTPEFYTRHAVEVAKDLLGKKLVFGKQSGIITETEAYRGADDEASHAFCGKTKRSAIMFGPPGYSYVYLIYGMHHCFNIVTEQEGEPSAVLIRGLLIGDKHVDGPGKLCRALGMTREHNGINLLAAPDFYVTEGIHQPPYQITSRIGISKAMEKPWRFVMELKPIFIK